MGWAVGYWLVYGATASRQQFPSTPPPQNSTGLMTTLLGHGCGHFTALSVLPECSNRSLISPRYWLMDLHQDRKKTYLSSSKAAPAFCWSVSHLPQSRHLKQGREFSEAVLYPSRMLLAIFPD